MPLFSPLLVLFQLSLHPLPPNSDRIGHQFITGDLFVLEHDLDGGVYCLGSNNFDDLQLHYAVLRVHCDVILAFHEQEQLMQILE